MIKKIYKDIRVEKEMVGLGMVECSKINNLNIKKELTFWQAGDNVIVVTDEEAHKIILQNGFEEINV